MEEQSLILYQSILAAADEYHRQTTSLFILSEEWKKELDLIFSGYATAITKILSRITALQSELKDFDRESHILALDKFLKQLRRELLDCYDKEVEQIQDDFGE